ncbi:hypothetical protein B0H13DRAFT_2429641 [Mycena leptocephala]|nr:hypothetical protein B0H13DRAFT_2429641 [Mycena leptocephala]
MSLFFSSVYGASSTFCLRFHNYLTSDPTPLSLRVVDVRPVPLYLHARDEERRRRYLATVYDPPHEYESATRGPRCNPPPRRRSVQQLQQLFLIPVSLSSPPCVARPDSADSAVTARRAPQPSPPVRWPYLPRGTLRNSGVDNLREYPEGSGPLDVEMDIGAQVSYFPGIFASFVSQEGSNFHIANGLNSSLFLSYPAAAFNGNPYSAELVVFSKFPAAFSLQPIGSSGNTVQIVEVSSQLALTSLKAVPGMSGAPAILAQIDATTSTDLDACCSSWDAPIIAGNSKFSRILTVVDECDGEAIFFERELDNDKDFCEETM